MPPKSLVELTTLACIKNIKEVGGVGFLNYETVRDILLKVDHAIQLRQIELNSPQIQGQTGEVWLKIVERDFPLEHKVNLYKPQDPKKWYRVWEKYKKEHDDALEESEKKLKIALAGLRQDKEKNTSKIVRGKQLPVGKIGPKRHYGPRDTAGSILTFGGGSRTKTSNGASVMRKVRREVKEIANIHGSLSRPVKVPSRPVGIKRTPETIVNDCGRATQPVYRPTPKEPAQLSALEEHEQRAIFLSDFEEDDDDDLAPVERTTVEPQPSLVRDAKAQPTSKPVAIVVSKPYVSSLMKKFAPPTKSPVRKLAITTALATPSMTKTPELFPNNPNRTMSNLQGKELHLSMPPRFLSSKPTDTSMENSMSLPACLAQTWTTPPLEHSGGQCSPQVSEEIHELKALPEVQHVAKFDVVPRKRKAVDVFMRPKRRAT